MTIQMLPDIAEVSAFVDHFVMAVDFQTPVPVSGDSRLADLPEWDSLAALGVIVMCDTEYGVAITGEDLKGCATVIDILTRVLEKKGA